MTDLYEAVRLHTDAYKRQLDMLRPEGTSRFDAVFSGDLGLVGRKLETPLSPDLHMAAGYMALLDIENDEGVTRMAVPFLDARRDGGVTNESMHRNAYNLVDGFITKYKVPIVREDGEDLLVGTYSFRARNGMLATVAKTWDACKWLCGPTNQDAISHLSKTLSEVELCMKISRHRWLKARSGKVQTLEC